MNEVSSPCLRWLSDDELHDELLGIWQEVKVLTGAVLYVPGEGLEEQMEVLKQFVMGNPGFMALTVSEVRHSFYLNMQGEYGEVYKHYYAPLNGEFVGSVLLGYLRYKHGLYSRHGVEVRKLVEVRKERKVWTDAELMDLVQTHYELYKNGHYELIVLPWSVYKLMRNVGGIRIKDKGHWGRCVYSGMGRREAYGRQSTARKDAWERENILRVRAIYALYHEEGWIPRSEYRVVVETFRRQLYLGFFNVMQYFGVKEIFKEVAVCRNQ
jgi:hypothetical protein